MKVIGFYSKNLYLSLITIKNAFTKESNFFSKKKVLVLSYVGKIRMREKILRLELG